MNPRAHVYRTLTMPRDVFPFQEDRDLVAAFLASAPPHPQSFATEAGTGLDYKGLRYNGHLIAHYDSAGALIGTLPPEHASAMAMPAIRLLHHMLDLLGVEARFTRESREGYLAYFYDSSEIKLGDPVLLAGPLGVSAHRAAHTRGPQHA
jgi:hypothetical protein